MAHPAQPDEILKNWLSELAGFGKAPVKLEQQIRAGDILIVVDMQEDLVNGSVAVPEAAEAERAVVKLVNHASKLGCRIVAVRSIHSTGHANFAKDGNFGFPPYCISGTQGARFTHPVGKAIADALRLSAERKDKATSVAFKGLRPDICNYGCFPYTLKLASQRLGMHELTGAEEGLLTQTGAFDMRVPLLEQDVNAMPDLRAAVGRTPLSELLWTSQEGARLFFCGLHLDFAVIDSACCASVATNASCYIVVEATRPAYAVHGDRTGYPPGFISSIDEHSKLLHSYKVKLCHLSEVLGNPHRAR